MSSTFECEIRRLRRQVKDLESSRDWFQKNYEELAERLYSTQDQRADLTRMLEACDQCVEDDLTWELMDLARELRGGKDPAALADRLDQLRDRLNNLAYEVNECLKQL